MCVCIYIYHQYRLSSKILTWWFFLAARGGGGGGGGHWELCCTIRQSDADRWSAAGSRRCLSVRLYGWCFTVKTRILDCTSVFSRHHRDPVSDQTCGVGLALKAIMVQSGETDAHMICRQAATLTHDPASRSSVSAHAHAADTTKKHTVSECSMQSVVVGCCVFFCSVSPYRRSDRGNRFKGNVVQIPFARLVIKSENNQAAYTCPCFNLRGHEAKTFPAWSFSKTLAKFFGDFWFFLFQRF